MRAIHRALLSMALVDLAAGGICCTCPITYSESQKSSDKNNPAIFDTRKRGKYNDTYEYIQYFDDTPEAGCKEKGRKLHCYNFELPFGKVECTKPSPTALQEKLQKAVEQVTSKSSTCTPGVRLSFDLLQAATFGASIKKDKDTITKTNMFGYRTEKTVTKIDWDGAEGTEKAIAKVYSNFNEEVQFYMALVKACSETEITCDAITNKIEGVKISPYDRWDSTSGEGMKPLDASRYFMDGILFNQKPSADNDCSFKVLKDAWTPGKSIDASTFAAEPSCRVGLGFVCPKAMPLAEKATKELSEVESNTDPNEIAHTEKALMLGKKDSTPTKNRSKKSPMHRIIKRALLKIRRSLRVTE